MHGEENIGIFGAYRQLNTNLYGFEGELERESRPSDSCMSCWAWRLLPLQVCSTGVPGSKSSISRRFGGSNGFALLICSQ